MSKSIDQAQKAKKSLLQHTFVMLVSCVVLQVIIYARGNRIDLISNLLHAGTALYYLWYHVTAKDLLSRVRFGLLVAHLIGFLAVSISYLFHAFILIISNNPAIHGNNDFAIEPGWFAILFDMITFWGIGLLIHMVASIANRGFEELPRG